jgi:hypothetical protein
MSKKYRGMVANPETDQTFPCQVLDQAFLSRPPVGGNIILPAFCAAMLQRWKYCGQAAGRRPDGRNARRKRA